MKNIKIITLFTIIISIIFFVLFHYSNSENYEIIYNNSGLKVTQSSDKGVSIINIDLTKLNINFGGVVSDNIFETPKTEGKRFNRISANKIYNFTNKNKILARINGQFFNAKINPTVLSFPIKSENKIISSYVDNNLQKRTFIIGKDDIPRILSGYQPKMLQNGDYKDLIVGINPNENFMKESSLAKNFMGILDETTIIFILATSKTQGEMTQLMYDQGVSQSNIIMFDGGPSAQFSFFDYSTEKPTVQSYYGGWAVPHFFVISKK